MKFVHVSVWPYAYSMAYSPFFCLHIFVSIAAEKDLMIAVSTLQVALQHIGKITGKVCTEDVLDVIFRDFCIGK